MINFNEELTYFKEKLCQALKIEISETIILKPKFINCKEPEIHESNSLMDKSNISYYEAKEQLNELAYGGKPPHNYQSWGDYWKSLYN